jgi:hypothetical protein
MGFNSAFKGLNTVTNHPSLKCAIMCCKPTNYSWDLHNFRPVLAAPRRQCLGLFRFVHNLCNSPPPPTPHFMHCCTTVSTLYLHYYILLLLPLALPPVVGFGLSNNTSPFVPILHQLSPSSHSQHLKNSFYFLLNSIHSTSRAGRLLAVTKIYT